MQALSYLRQRIDDLKSTGFIPQLLKRFSDKRSILLPNRANP
jgi:hypothetical protein